MPIQNIFTENPNKIKNIFVPLPGNSYKDKIIPNYTYFLLT